MGEFFNQLPETVKGHIKDITKTSGLPSGDDSVELMSEAWLGKMEAFDRQIEEQNMEEIEGLDKNDERGVLIMTYSGSLVNIGPLEEDHRSVEYTSIGIRNDVPESAEHSASVLGGDIDVNCEIEFTEGPVDRTSAAFKIAVCKENLSSDEQKEALSNATMILTREFADINKTVIIE